MLAQRLKETQKSRGSQAQASLPKRHCQGKQRWDDIFTKLEWFNWRKWFGAEDSHFFFENPFLEASYKLSSVFLNPILLYSANILISAHFDRIFFLFRWPPTISWQLRLERNRVCSCVWEVRTSCRKTAELCTRKKSLRWSEWDGWNAMSFTTRSVDAQYCALWFLFLSFFDFQNWLFLFYFGFVSGWAMFAFKPQVADLKRYMFTCIFLSFSTLSWQYLRERERERKRDIER